MTLTSPGPAQPLISLGYPLLWDIKQQDENSLDEYDGDELLQNLVVPGDSIINAIEQRQPLLTQSHGAVVASSYHHRRRDLKGFADEGYPVSGQLTGWHGVSGSPVIDPRSNQFAGIFTTSDSHPKSGDYLPSRSIVRGILNATRYRPGALFDASRTIRSLLPKRIR